MKKIIYIFTVMTSLMLFASCVHDSKEVFSESAAVRLDNAVKEYQKILESAPNGWMMTLWTGENYSGGGYTMFLKFKDGKVYAQSEIAPASMVTCSDYAIVKDQGPVLSFNTYNNILHYMAVPSSTLLNGNEGDFEFVFKEVNENYIVVQGKKWGNKMIMSRIPDNYDNASVIEKMQSNLKSICGYFTDDNDVIIVDPSTRTLYVNSLENASPYQLSDNGIVPLYNIKRKNGSQIKYLVWNASDKTITDGDYTYTYYEPEGYNHISKWYGDWQLRYLDGSTLSYNYLDLKFEPEEDLIQQEAMGALKGSFTLQGYTFELIVYYSPITGNITIPAQYVADPTETFGLFLLLGTDANADALSWYAVDWNSQWDEDNNTYKLVGDSSQANDMDMNTLQLLVVNSAGNLVANSDGLPMALISLPYVDYLTKK